MSDINRRMALVVLATGCAVGCGGGTVVDPLTQDPPIFPASTRQPTPPAGTPAPTCPADTSKMLCGPLAANLKLFDPIVIGTNLVVIRDDRGMQAVNLICTHLGCPVKWDYNTFQFVCPCHGSVYDPRGKVLVARVITPPQAPLTTHPACEAADGYIYVDLSVRL